MLLKEATGNILEGLYTFSNNVFWFVLPRKLHTPYTLTPSQGYRLNEGETTLHRNVAPLQLSSYSEWSLLLRFYWPSRRSWERTKEWWAPSVRPGFLTFIWKSNHSVNFKFDVCICWVSVQNGFAFGDASTIFAPYCDQTRQIWGNW